MLITIWLGLCIVQSYISLPDFGNFSFIESCTDLSKIKGEIGNEGNFDASACIIERKALDF